MVAKDIHQIPGTASVLFTGHKEEHFGLAPICVNRASLFFSTNLIGVNVQCSYVIRFRYQNSCHDSTKKIDRPQSLVPEICIKSNQARAVSCRRMSVVDQPGQTKPSTFFFSE
jgi:hypothetical protein